MGSHTRRAPLPATALPITPPSWHLEGAICTWVAQPWGGGGATFLAARGATHRLLTAKGVFPYTSSSPVLLSAAL